MKKLFKILVVVLGVLVLAAVGAYVWASMASQQALSQTIDTHRVEFPVPFPTQEPTGPEPPASAGGSAAGAPQPAADARAGASDASAAGGQQDLAGAIERGRHLVQSRYVCIECHGSNFGGGTMIDAFPIGRILGPNLTTGQGSVTRDYTPTDWDRIVRHGVKYDGSPALMPSEDFQRMSDQELSDIVAYIRSMPPVDNEVPEPSLGPLGKFLIATGQLHLSANLIPSHHSPHRAYPPPAEPTVEFGEHLAGVCMGCHKIDFSGGPIVGGDPAWVPASNLTPHPDALGGWSYEQFARALREGVRPDGTPLRLPMTLVVPYAQRMSEVETRAIWMYFQSLPPVAPAATE
jgi:mono/diheme cytochrome c family protein